MNVTPNVDMFEVTRLTREGRLREAMAMLRGDAPDAGPIPAEASASRVRDTRGAGPAATIDMVPPSSPEGAWEPPHGKAAGAPADASAAAGAIPEAMRGFIERLGRPGKGLGFGGAARLRPASVQEPLPAGARFEERVFSNGAGSRSYKLYIPSGYKEQPLPLVVMLHGCTQSPDDFAAGTRMNDLAEEMTFLVAYPAQTASANASRCWNWFNAADQQRGLGEPSLIAGITQEIMRSLPVEPGRVFVAGLSAGGAAAAIMGAAYPELYAAVGVHSGLACGAARDMPSAFAAMRQGGAAPRWGTGRAVPTIVFHGDGDTTVNPINGDQVAAQSGSGLNLHTSTTHGRAPGGLAYTRTVASDAAGRAMLEQWVLHGAGHAWSGGSPRGSYTEPRGPDASREMMRFFLDRPGSGVSSA
ncbi:extracellular catalytic domain type 1 short-chain-length polyhydroxyalkanoate depolymerase [Microvirga pudoricolor]|uniref:extracellular catalytic domain type 1 short-chain-length polyhydroxyalkanoate depolymerase n=1 Tax=Microvirga pudoricolor TaxID=2778729 RepID=UPI00194E425C|nr:PHB depolymerase family esterase [Microvirga pudoricolor]MBM6595702.1 PHB depolymerase family esterase [Microvirga pudoricolor]